MMLQTLKKAIQDEAVLDMTEITEDSTINSLGIDSLETTEFVLNIEDQTGISIPDDFDISGERRLKDIAADLQEIADGTR